MPVWVSDPNLHDTKGAFRGAFFIALLRMISPHLGASLRKCLEV